jgi:hypothetical protein
MNKNLSVINRVYGASNIVFGLETSTGTETFTANQNKPKSKKLANIIASDSQNTIINSSQTIYSGSVNQTVLDYINNNKQVTGTYSSPTIIVFAADFAQAPSGFTTTKKDFIFFCNGQLIESTAIINFVYTNTNLCTLTIDQNELGYTFDSTDEVIAIGKFA